MYLFYQVLAALWDGSDRDTLPDRKPDPPACQPAPPPFTSTEDEVAAAIIRRVVDGWPGYEPEGDA